VSIRVVVSLFNSFPTAAAALSTLVGYKGKGKREKYPHYAGSIIMTLTILNESHTFGHVKIFILWQTIWLVLGHHHH